jgi:hypothetical protein
MSRYVLRVFRAAKDILQKNIVQLQKLYRLDCSKVENIIHCIQTILFIRYCSNQSDSSILIKRLRGENRGTVTADFPAEMADA